MLGWHRWLTLTNRKTMKIIYLFLCIFNVFNLFYHVNGYIYTITTLYFLMESRSNCNIGSSSPSNYWKDYKDICKLKTCGVDIFDRLDIIVKNEKEYVLCHECMWKEIASLWSMQKCSYHITHKKLANMYMQL